MPPQQILNEALFQEDLGAQRDRARKTFDLADTDGSGYLTVDELPSVVRSLGLKLTDEETLRLAKKLFKEIDSDHSGRMDFNEFFHFYQSVLDNEKARRKLAKKLQKRALSQREKDEAAQVFGLYDKDNSGSSAWLAALAATCALLTGVVCAPRVAQLAQASWRRAWRSCCPLTWTPQVCAPWWRTS